MSAVRIHIYLCDLVGRTSIVKSSLLMLLVLMLMRQNCHAVLDERSIRSARSPERYCFTTSCIKASRYLRMPMNLTADPCEDFYEYSCGLWSELIPVKEGYAAMLSSYTPLDKIRVLLKQFLIKLSNEKTANDSIGLLKLVYDACMDEDAIEKAGSKPLFDLLDRLFGKTLRLKVFLQNNHLQDNGKVPIEYLVAKLWTAFSVSTLVSLDVSPDQNNASISMLLLGKASPALRFSSFSQSIRNEYSKTMKKTFAALSDSEHPNNDTTNSIDEIVEEVLDFEISLAQISTATGEERDQANRYHKITIEQLQATGNKFNWTVFLQFIKPVEHVNIMELGYFRRLNSLLDKTRNYTVYRYLAWRLISHLERRYADLTAINGVTKRKERLQFCIGYLINTFGVIVGKVLAREINVDNDTKIYVEQMVTELKSAFMVRLRENTWMDEATKEKAGKKIAQTILTISHPDEINNVDEIYASLIEKRDGYVDTAIMPGDSFFEMDTKIQAWFVQNAVNLIDKPSSRRVISSPIDSTGMYYMQKNSITLPGGILHPPFFHITLVAAVNFGAIGSLIGHEITHAVDDVGAEHDGTGNLKNWWTNSSKEMFNERINCFIEQYSNFCYPELGESVCVNGENTMGENIADNGGIKQSFAAYKAFTRGKPQDVLLAMENFTMDQLFFLSYANYKCANYNKEFLRHIIATDGHAPNRNRVIGTLRNSDEFAKAFNCPVGSAMNPEKKCVIW